MILYASLSLSQLSMSESKYQVVTILSYCHHGGNNGNQPGDGAKISTKHKRSFHQTPERKHALVLNVRHTTLHGEDHDNDYQDDHDDIYHHNDDLANEQPIWVVPPKLWSLDTSLPVSLLSRKKVLMMSHMKR